MLEWIPRMLNKERETLLYFMEFTDINVFTRKFGLNMLAEYMKVVLTHSVVLLKYILHSGLDKVGLRCSQFLFILKIKESKS